MPSGSPHFTKVTDLVENINPVTGRSVNYGLRPWRCDDRFQDHMLTFLHRDWGALRDTWRMFRKCATSEFGEEPVDPYHTLQRREVMFYVDRFEAGMIRDKLIEAYPYNCREVARVSQDDGTKMRVWRHQRELELEAKEGKLDDLISNSVFGNRAPSARASRGSVFAQDFKKLGEQGK